MQILADPIHKRALQDLNGDADMQLPSFLSSEVVPIGVGVLDKIYNPLTPRVWNPRSMTDMAVTVAVGLANLQPEAGVFTLTYDGDETDPISYDATAGNIDTELNALTSIIAAGGVTVSGDNGYFFVVFNDPGARDPIVGDGDNLAPLTIVQLGTLLTGTAELQEIQTIRLFQSAAAFATLATNSAAVAGAVDVLQVGGGGFNAKVRLAFSPVPYEGQWAILVNAEETSPISYNATADEVTELVEALSTVGAGNVSVGKEGDGSYVLTFIEAKANTAMTVTLSVAALKAVSLKSGFLDFRTSGIQVILDGQQQAQAYFEVTGTNPGEDPQTLFRTQVTLLASVVDPETLTDTPLPSGDFYTEAEAQQRFPELLPTVTRATGGLATDLDGIPTAGWVAPRVVRFVEAATGGLKEYLYRAGSDASDPPLIIRPVDFNAISHAFIFQEIA